MKICLVCEGISDTEQTHCTSCGLRLVDGDEVHFPVRRGEQDAAHPLLGAVIDGKYRITDVVGKGGMGTVFAAVHEVSLVGVALKLLHLRHATRPELRRYFVEEARKAGRVNHEHSARVLDVGEDEDGTVYIAMELVEGVTLDEWMDQGEGLGLGDLVDILSQICSALSSAHAAGLVHRDLTPRNVMALVRDARPFVKILDFGIAKGPPQARGDGDGSPARFANPPYTAPEYLAGEPTDARADLYSVGVLAYECLMRRSPLEPGTTDEMVQATIEGRLLPLRPPKGTPARLARLVRALLARDPDRRPPDAAAVMRELAHVRNPRRLLLRGAAIASLLLSLPAFVVAHSGDGAEPQLFDVQGNLRFDTQLPRDAVEVQGRDLDPLELGFAGFDGAALTVETAATGVSERFLLAPQIAPGGAQLVLSSATSPAWGDLLAELRALARPAVLVFEAPGRPRMRFCKVLLDDAAPALELEVDTAEPGELAGGSDVVFGVQDAGSLRRYDLVLEWQEGSEQRQVRRPLLNGARQVEGSQRLKAAELFGDLPELAGVRARLDAVLRLEAEDEAGNRSDSEWACRAVDLAAPAVTGVFGRRHDDIVTYGSEGAPLRIEWGEDPADPERQPMALVVRLPDGKTELRLELGHEVLLPRSSDVDGAPFADGVYVFAVRDAAGNVGPSLQRQLRFEPEGLGMRLAVPASEGPITARVVDVGGASTLVTDGGAADLLLACNEVFTPTVAEVLGTTDRVELPVRDARPGSGRVELPESVPHGVYELRVTMVDSQEEQQHYAVPWHVLQRVPRVRVADTSSARFLQQLVERDVLVRHGDRVAFGNALRIEDVDRRLLRGRAWVGRVGQLSPEPLRAADERTAELFAPWVVLRGANTVALELRDPFDRPLPVLLGERRVPADLEVGDGSRAVGLARFFHGAPPPVAEAEVECEFDRPVRVALLCDWPLAAGDRVTAALPNSKAYGVVVEPRADGARLSFELPFADVATALDLGGRRESFPEGREAELPVRLATPAGPFEVAVRVRTVRSALRPLPLRRLAVEDASVAAPLREIVMVPVLGPRDGVWRDPVPAGIARSGLRPATVTERVGDGFLQDRELTRAQYDALIALGERWAGSEIGTRCVFAGDPAGADRLQRLRPLIYPDDFAWRQAVASGPERPVTGVSYFQAHTAIALAGVALAGDPKLLRLPTGLELEIAALGSTPTGLNGIGREAPRPTLAELERWSGRSTNPARWPATHAELAEFGDSVSGEQGAGWNGLDTGVREWVLDLPAASPDDLLLELLRDHARHVERALELGDGGALFRDAELAILVERYGVLRGLALGEPWRPVDVQGRRLSDPSQPLTAGVAGVVVTLMLRRDGLDETRHGADPRLARVGFRMAAGAPFLAWVRR